MSQVLTDQQVHRYRETGIHFPVNAFTDDEIAELLREFESLESRDGGRLAPRTNQKPHLLVPWLADLIRSPRILDAVQDVLGQDILCWSSQFFAKDAGDPGFVSWHQDGTYWGLSTQDVLTVWLAFTPSTPLSGCMRVVPGTHRTQVAHRDTFAQTNMLSRGQEVAVDVRAEDVVDVTLRPGQFSLHNVLLFHGSEPNRADHRRIGLAIRYMPPHVRQTVGAADSATLVRGTDPFGHFELEHAPRRAFDDAAVAHHRQVTDRQAQTLYTGATQVGRRVTSSGRERQSGGRAEGSVQAQGHLGHADVSEAGTSIARTRAAQPRAGQQAARM